MVNRITFPKSSGDFSRQAHADFPEQAPFEREISREGFYGPATHIHHKHAPTGWIENKGHCRPRAFNLYAWPQDHSSLWNSEPVLHNPYCRVTYWTLSDRHFHNNQLFRNSDGDLLLFIHQGKGELFCDFGHLSFSEGDYLLIPRGTLWRLESDEIIHTLAIEATDQLFGLPDKGVVGQHAIFDNSALITPEIDDVFLAQQDENEWTIQVKHDQRASAIRYPYNPLDALGWHGDLCVVKINWRDIRPLMSHRYHLAPSAHTTFVTDHFVVCTFVPRPFESDPGALKVPFYHSNEDFDEIIFYHQGDFFSRDNIQPGMLTFHPRGFTHGPHPKAYQQSFSKQHDSTNEVAVMIDTRQSMLCATSDNGLPKNVEWLEYNESWCEKDSSL
ncbi:homogentisate 1,2-dioxygenase [Gammaproteobacteria bacterium 45_16_T64]|nr:homogentisate 1,2-dioxygenase [Gammaproteobacteria bacterium 45_16_T64]